MFGRSFRLGSVGGVEIRAHASWTVIAVLIVYSLYGQLTTAYRTLTAPAGAVLAAAAAALFFGSVLAHELTHALVARRVGIAVKGITLFVFGGATHAEVESHGPRDEFLVSAVGPLSSLGLGGLFWGLSALGHGLVAAPVLGALRYLGWVNLLLAGFNLLPGFPLDGGRMFRSAVWGATHSLTKATRAATAAGQAIGYLLVAGGLLLLFGPAAASGIWFAAIGWFLAQAARAGRLELELRGLLSGAEVEQAMTARPIPIPADLPLGEAVDRYLVRHDEAFPVDDRDRVVGVLTAEAAKAVPRDQRPGVTVGQIMRPIDPGLVVTPHTPMTEVVRRLRERPSEPVLVMRDGQLAGLVTAGDLEAWVRRRQAWAAELYQPRGW